MVKTLLLMKGINKEVKYKLPTSETIYQEIKKSSITEVQNVKTVILGYVEALETLSDDKEWKGGGDFKYKNITNDIILLGCEHSYWGDISYYVVKKLAEQGVQNVIYIGKLGSLESRDRPNEKIATGNHSIFHDGAEVKWNNIFKNYCDNDIVDGVHYTIPSVLKETKEWVENNKNKIMFVDPEIGQMAKAAVENDIIFSYLHIISDNLTKDYTEDLSNERKTDVKKKREKLLSKIKGIIYNIFIDKEMEEK